MDHRAMRERLEALYDGALSAAQHREVEEHLRTCSACRQAYADWQELAQRLFRAAEPAPSEAFVQRVMDRLAAAQHPAPWVLGIRWLVPAVGLAGVLIAAAIGQQPNGISVDALLLDDTHGESSAQWMLASEPATVDEALGWTIGAER